MTDDEITDVYDDFYTQEDDRESRHILGFARALLARAQADSQAPVAPDSNMLQASVRAWHLWKSRDNGGNIQELGALMWEHMLNAAPQPTIAPSVAHRGGDALTEEMIEAGAEFIYGHPRSKAVEWAKEDKFDSCAAQAKEIFTVMSANYWRGL